MKPNLLSFLKQNWALLLYTLLAIALVLNEWLFQHLGALLYVPAAVFVWASVWRFCIHLRFRETIDADSHSGRAKRDWDSITPAERTLNTTLIKIGIGIAIAIVAASVGHATTPDQAARWEAARINPRASIRLDQAIALYQRNASRYERIAGMRANGVPAPVLFCLHLRESDNNFRCHPHEGSPLTHRTRFIPKGRLPPPKEPPFTFEESAEDAYYVCDRLDLKDWRHLAPALDAMELFNGPGYRRPGKPPSPYLWASTTIERPGKFVADGRFSFTARDQQLGCAAILKRMEERGIALPFAL